MPTLLDHIEELNRMVQDDAGKDAVLVQINVVWKIAAAQERENNNLVSQHAELQKEHSALQNAKAQPTADTPRKKIAELENIQQSILVFLFMHGAKVTAKDVATKFSILDESALFQLEELERFGFLEREIVGGSSVFPESRPKIFPDKWGLNPNGRRSVVESGITNPKGAPEYYKGDGWKV